MLKIDYFVDGISILVCNCYWQ